MNPLLDFSGLPRFAQLKPEHVTPAVEVIEAALKHPAALLAPASVREAVWAEVNAFRGDSHKYIRDLVVKGAAVRLCMDKGCELESLPIDELKSLNPAFENDFYAAVKLQASKRSRK